MRKNVLKKKTLLITAVLAVAILPLIAVKTGVAFILGMSERIGFIYDTDANYYGIFFVPIDPDGPYGIETYPGRFNPTSNDFRGFRQSEPNQTIEYNEAGAWNRFGRFVDRGQMPAFDYTLANFTTDGTWRDLDLSSIVPSGARAVVLRIQIGDNLINQGFSLRQNGDTGYGECNLITQVANQYIESQDVVSCDTNRIIEYFAANTTWTTISIYVCGWYL